jgi:hypothetical protein
MLHREASRSCPHSLRWSKDPVGGQRSWFALHGPRCLGGEGGQRRGNRVGKATFSPSHSALSYNVTNWMSPTPPPDDHKGRDTHVSSWSCEGCPAVLGGAVARYPHCHHPPAASLGSPGQGTAGSVRAVDHKRAPMVADWFHLAGRRQKLSLIP